MTSEQLTEQLKSLLGDTLHSVILYGSAATGDQTKHYSNINILLVVERVNERLLESVSPLIKKWRKEGHPSPLILTEQTIQDSLDVFPIEYLDIQGSHRVLYGNDSFTGLVVNHDNLRHEIEFELRSKLIQLETRFIEAEGKEVRIQELISKSLSSLTALFNATVRLAGGTPAQKKRDIWTALNALVPLDLAALEEILKIRDGQKSTVSARELFSRLLVSVQSVIEFVDQSH